jgi:hypothetical protein
MYKMLKNWLKKEDSGQTNFNCVNIGYICVFIVFYDLCPCNDVCDILESFCFAAIFVWPCRVEKRMGLRRFYVCTSCDLKFCDQFCCQVSSITVGAHSVGLDIVIRGQCSRILINVIVRHSLVITVVL